MWRKEFIDLCFNQDPAKIDITKAYDLKERNLPSSLYKYRPFNDHSLELIENDKMWLSNPNDFNDPFDCAVTIIPKQIAAETLNQSVDKLMQDSEYEFTTDEISHIKMSRNPFYEFCIITAKKFVPKVDTHPKLIELMSKPDEYAETLSKAAEEEYDDFYKILLENIKEKIRITCLSEKKDSILMWSHYADNHKGICIEYDFRPLGYRDLAKRFLYPVNYVNSVFDATKYFLPDAALPNIVCYAAITKSEDWSYEYEWRYVEIDNITGQPYLKVPKLKSVYLGAKTSKENEKIILEIAEHRRFKVYKMEIMNLEFGLESNRIF